MLTPAEQRTAEAKALEPTDPGVAEAELSRDPRARPRRPDGPGRPGPAPRGAGRGR
jgi:hypothetical protein